MSAVATPGIEHEVFRDDAATESERSDAMLCHLIGLASMVPGVALLGLIGVIILYNTKKGRSEYFDDHGLEALNFQISLVLYQLLYAALTIPTFGASSVVGPVLVGALALVGSIRGALFASRGEYYRYPMSVRMICAKKRESGSSARA